MKDTKILRRLYDINNKTWLDVTLIVFACGYVLSHQQVTKGAELESIYEYFE